MMRLIDANKLHEVIAEQERWNVPDFVYESIKNAPTIDAVPVRQGKWVLQYRNEDICGREMYCVRQCSLCEAYYRDVGHGWNYCPNCGARMDEVEG